MDFRHDLAVMATGFLNQAGIKVPEEWDDYHICMKYLEIHQRWFDSSVPYDVLYSKELIAKMPTLTLSEQQAIQEIDRRLKNCEPLTPYMSRDIRKVSVKKSDFLLKNWNIYHLHLERSDQGETYKSSNLLFFQPKGSTVHFIDVKPHPKGAGWFDRELLEIVFDNWPNLLNYMQDLKPVGTVSDDKMHELLKRTVAIIEFRGGALFPTNLGVASSGDSNLAVREAGRLFNHLKLFEIELAKREDEIRQEILDSMQIDIKDTLDYDLIVEEGYFVAYEKHSLAKIRLFPA